MNMTYYIMIALSVGCYMGYRLGYSRCEKKWEWWLEVLSWPTVQEHRLKMEQEKKGAEK